ncbi:hypothetical protein STANM309S_04471 [Streptomyces tanashiensis]
MPSRCDFSVGTRAYVADLADPQVEALRGHRLLGGAHQPSVRTDAAAPLDQPDHRFRRAGQRGTGPVAQDGGHPRGDVHMAEAVLPREAGELGDTQQSLVEHVHVEAADLAAEVELQELEGRAVVVRVGAAQLGGDARPGPAQQRHQRRFEPDLGRVPLDVPAEEPIRQRQEEVEQPLQVPRERVRLRCLDEPGPGEQVRAPGRLEGRRQLGPRDGRRRARRPRAGTRPRMSGSMRSSGALAAFEDDRVRCYERRARYHAVADPYSSSSDVTIWHDRRWCRRIRPGRSSGAASPPRR